MYESTFYAMRQPLLPANKLFDFFHIAENNDEQKVLEYLIQEFTQNYQLEEALYLASDVLYNEFIKYKSSSSLFSDKEKKKIIHSLSKYYIRASSRATPFGLFANFREGSFDNLEINNDAKSNELIYHPKLDMEILYQIGEYILNLDGIKKYLTLYNNTSLYKTKDSFRYIEYRMTRGNRTHHLVSIAYDNLLNFIIKVCKKGISYNSLVTNILEKYDVAQKDIENYINDLISCKLLMTNIDINVTGENYFDLLCNFTYSILNEHSSEEIDRVKSILQSVNQLLKGINHNQSNIPVYKEIYKILKEILPNIPEKNLIQLDVISDNKDHTLPYHSQSDLNKLLSIFSAFAKSYPPHYFQLEVFKRAFSERYEDQKVKLTEALDEEIGIGYKSAMSIKDAYNSKKRGKTKLAAFVLKKYHEFLKQHKQQIEITDYDIKEDFRNIFDEDASEPGFTYLLNAYPRVGEEKVQLHVISYSPSISGLSGRFCGIHEEYYKKMNNIIHTIEKENGEYVYAEIVHLPQARVGNVIARPYLGDYEIPFLANSLLPVNQKILVDDLYIQMINNHLYLFSEKLNKPIQPRLSNAHNYRNNGLPIYQFLCDMQFQGFGSQMIWDWGIIEDIEDYLPRVVYKNIILQQAYWIIKGNNFNDLRKSKGFVQFKNVFCIIKEKLTINDLVVFKEGDNVLYIDLSTDLGIELLQKYFNRSTEKMILYESLLSKTVKGDTIQFSKELVVPFIKKKNKIKVPLKTVPFNKDTVTRIFIPGSEWIYFKIYISNKFSNKILAVLCDYIERKLINKRFIDTWFFMRYADPKQHIRIRLHVKDLSKMSVILLGISNLLNSYTISGKISSIIQDTYYRELERYKSENIVASESLFYYDSKMIYEIYRAYDSLYSKQLFFIGYYIVEEYLSTLTSNIEKFIFLERSFKYFSKEFDYENDKTLRNSLHDELRKIKDVDISKKIDDKVIHIIDQSKFKSILFLIKSNVRDDYFNILGSYIHMSVNRLFSDRQRLNEFRIYFFLYKKYQSILARESKVI